MRRQRHRQGAGHSARLRKERPGRAGAADEAKRALGGHYREFLLARPAPDKVVPSCFHNDGSGRSVVLDPCAGAGTTGLVAVQHVRSFIGVELSVEYAEMARNRIATAERLGFRSPRSGPVQIAGQVSMIDLLDQEAA